jgi:hypothetical protein
MLICMIDVMLDVMLLLSLPRAPPPQAAQIHYRVYVVVSSLGGGLHGDRC